MFNVCSYYRLLTEQVYVALILYNYVRNFLVPVSAGSQTILRFKVDSRIVFGFESFRA
jgi:hypothetical protein